MPFLYQVFNFTFILLRVRQLIDDVRCVLDEGKVTLLTLLDLSAAFDTVEHSLLVNHLSDMGVQGDALTWFINYLSGRSLSVFRDTTSSRRASYKK